jgi:hypothetical protein
MNQFIYLIGSVLLMSLLLRTLFKQKEIQFKLLKELFPKKLEGVNSYLGFMSGFKGASLPSLAILWIYFPIYFKTTFKEEENIEGINSYRSSLSRSNKILLGYFIGLLVWLFVFGEILL